MSHSARLVAACVFVVACAFNARAQADIDATGAWVTTIFDVTASSQWVQTGSLLTVDLTNFPPLSSSFGGTIDPVTGIFSLEGSSICPFAGDTITGTVAPDSRTFTGFLSFHGTFDCCLYGMCGSEVFGTRASCPPAPQTCRTAERSLLLVKNQSNVTNDKLLWKWLKGAATTLTELGVPTGTTNYTLCVYAGTAVATINLPAGSDWQAAGTKGFKFKDPTGIPDGAQGALLKSGAAGKAKALVKGKGSNLPKTLAPPLSLPVTAQLVNDTNSTCFQGVYSTAIKNDAKQFKAKTP